MKPYLGPSLRNRIDARLKPLCPRCGAVATETYRPPCGCVEAICEACCEPPRYLSWMIKSEGCKR